MARKAEDGERCMTKGKVDPLGSHPLHLHSIVEVIQKIQAPQALIGDSLIHDRWKTLPRHVSWATRAKL